MSSNWKPTKPRWSCPLPRPAWSRNPKHEGDSVSIGETIAGLKSEAPGRAEAESRTRPQTDGRIRRFM